MILTLSPGERLVIDLEETQGVTFASLKADALEGRIRPAEPSAARAIVVLDYTDDGTVWVVNTVAGDYNGDGVLTIDDTSVFSGVESVVTHTAKIVTGDIFSLRLW